MFNINFSHPTKIRTRIMIRMYIRIYILLFTYIHIADATLPDQLFGCHSQVHASVRAAHNMRSWRLYWHYLTLTCRISQLSQGDPDTRGPRWWQLLWWFTEFSFGRMQWQKVTLLSWKYTRCWTWHHLVKVAPQLSPSLFGDRRSRRKQTQERSNEMPPLQKKIRSRSLSPPSSEVEVGGTWEKGHQLWMLDAWNMCVFAWFPSWPMAEL